MTSNPSGQAPDQDEAPAIGAPLATSTGRLRLVLGGLVAAAAVGGAFWALSLNGSSPKTSQAERDQAAVTGNYAGLQETAAPWQPEYRFLVDRLTTSASHPSEMSPSTSTCC